MSKCLFVPGEPYATYEEYRRAKRREALKAWKAKHPELHLQRELERRRKKYANDEQYREKIKVAGHARYEAKKDEIKAKVKQYTEANREKKRMYHREYNWIKRRKLVQATPAWADLEKIRAFYKEARKQGLEVDHIIPISGTNVSGLHTIENLQMLSRSENASKGNRYAG